MPAENMIPFTSVFRAADTHRIKRNRAALSCTSCQRRKSKCDRGQPCGACEKRGDASGCRFGPQGAPAMATGRHELQARLNKLEELVKVLAESPPTGPGQHHHNGSDAVDLHASRERSLVDDAEIPYHGPTSWAAIVDSIHDIQNSLEVEREREGNPQQATVGLDIILGDSESAPSGDLIECLPPRPEMDRLVQAYFNSKFVSSTFVHAHHFRRRYERLLADPKSVNYLWTSILYSILCIGALVLRTRNSTGVSLANIASPNFYMSKASECLVVGEYLKAKPFSVEAVLLHAQCRNVLQKDFDPTIWSLYGLAIRLAQRRGYHRSSTKLASKITPFEAEMRRRAWSMMAAADIMYSFQLGMPTMINEDFCDVEPPTNLTDEDFDEDTPLPPPRPPNDPSPILAYAIKGKMCKILRRIMHRALSVMPQPFADVMVLDAQLAECYASIPPSLQHRPIRSTSFTDPNYTIMHRIMLQIMYLKSVCVLHRPYLTASKDDPKYRYSREACRNAALSMLDLHIELDREVQEGGRMYEDRYMVTSLALHDFLIAAMVVCLDLCESTDISPDEWATRIKALGTVHEIWISRGAESLDAQRASKVLGIILKKASLSERSRLCMSSSAEKRNYESFVKNGRILCQPEKVFSFPEEPPANVFDAWMNNSGNSEALDWIPIDEFLRQDCSENYDWQLPLETI